MMERELEKDLKEIEYLIYVHKNRGNTNTQSVLERVHEIIEPCAKAARTLSELEALLFRENGQGTTRSSRDNKCGECSRRTWYMKGYKDALKEDGVSEAFLEDCKRVAQKYKKDNDGWIPVEDRLPEDDVDVLVTYADIDDEEYADITTTTYGNAYLGGDKLDFKEWRSPFEYFKSNYKVTAWQYLPEPYRPERSSDEKE